MVRLEAAIRPVQEKLPFSVLRSYLSVLMPNSRSSGTKMGLPKVSARSVRVKGSVVDRRQGWPPGGGAVRRSYCRSKPLI
jgi:hypothetical protein